MYEPMKASNLCVENENMRGIERMIFSPSKTSTSVFALSKRPIPLKPVEAATPQISHGKKFRPVDGSFYGFQWDIAAGIMSSGL